MTNGEKLAGKSGYGTVLFSALTSIQFWLLACKVPNILKELCFYGSAITAALFILCGFVTLVRWCEKEAK